MEARYGLKTTGMKRVPRLVLHCHLLKIVEDALTFMPKIMELDLMEPSVSQFPNLSELTYLLVALCIINSKLDLNIIMMRSTDSCLMLYCKPCCRAVLLIMRS